MRVNLAGWYIPDKLLPGEPDPVDSQLEECRAQLACVQPFLGPARNLVIQAGARVGVWPLMLAQMFERVIAFEPDPANWECAAANVARCPNAIVFDAALGPRKRYAYLMRSALSSGEHYIAPPRENLAAGATRVAVTTIDEVAAEEGRNVDAIMLDVEGYELDVLEGARSTLLTNRPTLVLEENRLCQRYRRARGDLERWLKPLGYEYAGSYTKLPPEIQNDGHFRGADLIFVPK